MHTHEECETYLPSFCGLTRENALRIARVFDNKNCAIGTQSKLRITTASNGAGDDDDNSKIWPIFHEEQFEFLTVIGKGNFGKVSPPPHFTHDNNSNHLDRLCFPGLKRVDNFMPSRYLKSPI